MMPYGPPQLMADCDRKMREIAADKYGRKPSFGTVATVNTLVAETDNEAQDAIRPYIENSPFPITDESGDVIGSPETVVAAFQKFADLGINHFNIMCRTKTLEEQLRLMELISKEVTPHFKG